MQTRIVALDTAPIVYGGVDFVRPFAGLGEVVIFPDTVPDLLLDRARGAEFVLTNKVKLDAATLQQLAEAGLRYIGVLATGVNVVDPNAAKQLGLAVTNVKGYAAESVAQHVFALLLHVTNRVAAHALDVANGGWQGIWCKQVAPKVGLHGKTLGLIGNGDIGGAVGRVGAAFGMTVRYGEVPGRSYPEGTRVALPTLLQECDVISLHCPLSPGSNGTEKMVDERFLGRMKPTAVLINTGRGGLVDEAALKQALLQGRIAHAALDVLSVEPPPEDHPLVRLAHERPDLITITGHNGWTTPEALASLVHEAAENIRAFLAGKLRNRIV